MISIDMYATGAGIVTPPAVGLSSLKARPYPGSVVVATRRPANCGPVVGVLSPVVAGAEAELPVLGADAPVHGTGLPVAIRLRGFAAAGTPGSHTTGVTTGSTVQLNSTTPGDLPPEDPLS